MSREEDRIRGKKKEIEREIRIEFEFEFEIEVEKECCKIRGEQRGKHNRKGDGYEEDTVQ